MSNDLNIFDKDTQEYVIKTGRPILLEGRHGVGKTSVLRSLGSNFGLTIHELNASTLDSFVHIVGIPVVVDGKVTMSPPDELQAAEILFIDEINRADRPTRNALMEIICDNSVNGKKLENLKLIVAAMNPPDGEYHVDALDIALDDRFLHKFKVDPDISYALEVVPDEAMKAAIKKWYGALESPPSPRRLTWALEATLHEGEFNEPALLNALDDKLYGTRSLLQMIAKGAGLEVATDDHLLTDEEKSAISKVLHSAFRSGKFDELENTKQQEIMSEVGKKFLDEDGLTFLPTPLDGFNHKDIEAMNSDIVKEVIDLFPYDFSPASEWLPHETDEWLQETMENEV